MFQSCLWFHTPVGTSPWADSIEYASRSPPALWFSAEIPTCLLQCIMQRRCNPIVGPVRGHSSGPFRCWKPVLQIGKKPPEAHSLNPWWNFVLGCFWIRWAVETSGGERKDTQHEGREVSLSSLLWDVVFGHVLDHFSVGNQWGRTNKQVI